MNIADVDITNKWLLGTRADDVIMLNHNAAIRMTKIEALVLAAWLITLADDNDEFGLIIEKVQST